MAEDFDGLYAGWCRDHGQAVSPHVSLSPGPAIACQVDKLSTRDVGPVLHALSLDRTLRSVTLFASFLSQHRSSSSPAIPSFFSRRRLRILGGSLEHQLAYNMHLHTLALEGLVLSPKIVSHMAFALPKAKNLQHLSLAHSPLARSVIKVLCMALKKSASLQTLDVSDCGLSGKSVQAVAGLVRSQNLWSDWLRYVSPSKARLQGLSRLCMNHNPQLGDSEVKLLARALKYHPWLKTLELRHCQVGDTGAGALLEALQKNEALQALDLHNNPNVSADLVRKINAKLKANGRGEVNKHASKPACFLPPIADAQADPVVAKRSGEDLGTGELGYGDSRQNNSSDAVEGRAQLDVLKRQWSPPAATRDATVESTPRVNPTSEMERLQLQLATERDTTAFLKAQNAALRERLGQPGEGAGMAMPPPGFVLMNEDTLANVRESFSKFMGYLDQP